MKNEVKLFEQQKVRTHWDEKDEKWYFSVVDVIQILTDSKNPRRYWSDLKRKLQQEVFVQLYEFIVQLKLESLDRKKYTTDCADTKIFFLLSNLFLHTKQSLSNNGWQKLAMNVCRK